MKIRHFFPLILCGVTASCVSFTNDDDEPPFVTCPNPTPDFEQIMLEASASFNSWVVPSDYVDITASVTVTAPMNVKIKDYTLVSDGQVVDTYSEPSISVVASAFGHGAHHISLYANLQVDTFNIQKPVFEDNDLLVFNKRPTIKIGATLAGHITATSTSGETYDREFTAESNADGRICIPASLFAWTPVKGTASTMSVEMTFVPEVTDISAGLTAELTDLQWNLTDNTTAQGATAKLTWPNPVTEKEWYGLTPSCQVIYRGTYEDITLDSHFLDGFIILLTDSL